MSLDKEIPITVCSCVKALKGSPILVGVTSKFQKGNSKFWTPLQFQLLQLNTPSSRSGLLHHLHKAPGNTTSFAVGISLLLINVLDKTSDLHVGAQQQESTWHQASNVSLPCLHLVVHCPACQSDNMFSINRVIHQPTGEPIRNQSGVSQIWYSAALDNRPAHSDGNMVLFPVFAGTHE